MLNHITWSHLDCLHPKVQKFSTLSRQRDCQSPWRMSGDLQRRGLENRNILIIIHKKHKNINYLKYIEIVTWFNFSLKFMQYYFLPNNDDKCDLSTDPIFSWIVTPVSTNVWKIPSWGTSTRPASVLPPKCPASSWGSLAGSRPCSTSPTRDSKTVGRNSTNSQILLSSPKLPNSWETPPRRWHVRTTTWHRPKRRRSLNRKSSRDWPTRTSVRNRPSENWTSRQDFLPRTSREFFLSDSIATHSRGCYKFSPTRRPSIRFESLLGIRITSTAVVTNCWVQSYRVQTLLTPARA